MSLHGHVRFENRVSGWLAGPSNRREPAYPGYRRLVALVAEFFPLEVLRIQLLCQGVSQMLMTT